MTDIEILIRFWKGKLSDSGYMMDSAAKGLVQDTISYLEELMAIKGGWDILRVDSAGWTPLQIPDTGANPHDVMMEADPRD